MRSQDRVALVVAGEARHDWEYYEVESDLMTPADCWKVSLGLKDGVLPPKAQAGAECEIRVGNDRAMVGRIDETEHSVSKRGHQLELLGRDRAAVLLDCSAKIFTRRMSTLEEIVASVVRPLGITDIRIDAETLNPQEKVSVEPGDSAWEALVHAAEANGLWPSFTPDGTLVIGGPDYDEPIVGTLVLNRAGKGNNITELVRIESVAGRYSHMTVLGQRPGSTLEKGRRGLFATANDPDVPSYRPKILVDHEATSVAIAQSVARKKLADSRLEGLTFRVTVPGHRITSRKQAGPKFEQGQGFQIEDVSNGEPDPVPAQSEPLWTPGQRVHLTSDIFNVDAPFFLMARRFTGGRRRGSQTDLILKEDGMWILDAHPHKRHQRHRNVGKIIDLDAGG